MRARFLARPVENAGHERQRSIMSPMSLEGLLGVDVPILQAPMAGSQDSRLALAVAEAGGLGSLPCAMLDLEALRDALRALRGSKHPINLNFFCHAESAPDPEREQRFLRMLEPYYREYGVDPAHIKAARGRVPFSAETAEVLAEFRPAILSFHFGLPTPELMATIKGWGSKVLSSATTVEEARWLEAHGADAIIAQGSEAGGHRAMFLSHDISTQVGTLALVPQLVRAVRVPIIAAGGICDARGVAAARALGAAGVQVGTAYLFCHEATTTAVHRAALQGPGVHHTALTNLFTGRPARGIVNRLMRELGPMSGAVPAFPRAASAVAPLRQAAERAGDGAFSPSWAGQCASLCRPCSAGELTRELTRGL
jgi:nitronate monooxygenase